MLYEWWRNPQLAEDHRARWLSFTILTRSSTGRLGSVHDRMPVFVDEAHAEAWLDPKIENVDDLLHPVIDAAPEVAGTLDDGVVSKRRGQRAQQRSGAHRDGPAGGVSPAGLNLGCVHESSRRRTPTKAANLSTPHVRRTVRSGGDS